MAYAKMNNHREAEDAYKNALRLDPDNADYQNNLSVTQQRIQEGNGLSDFVLKFQYMRIKEISFSFASSIFICSCKCSTSWWSSTEFRRTNGRH